ncbi:uncharacterized protein LOC133196934 [Saccostrea echinata]|uniref:uncharacterized protein LOC133196934 n=1 Tax=Saccostrea echinata TaxID=191078 RepID=UPI002A8178CE|nr:uncharacterized protein LOC133196934 [Saccostrea echinata]
MSDNKGRGGSSRGGNQGKSRGGSHGEHRGGHSGRGNPSGNTKGGSQGGRNFPRGGSQGHSSGGQRPGQENFRSGINSSCFPRQPTGLNVNQPIRQPSLLGMPSPIQHPFRGPSPIGNPNMYQQPPQQIRGLHFIGQQPSYEMQPAYPPRVPPPPLLPPKHETSASAGSAKIVAKHPVTALNEMKTQVSYKDCPTNNDFVCVVAEVDGRTYEGYALTKKEAKKKAAEEALKILFNIICVEAEGSKEEQGPKESKEKSAKSKAKQEKKEERDEEKILNETLEHLKKLTMPGVNVVSDKPPLAQDKKQGTQSRNRQREQQERENTEIVMDGWNADSGGREESQAQRGRGRGGRRRRRGKGGTGALEDGEEMPEEGDVGNDSDNESVSSFVSESSRGRGNRRRGRGRNAPSQSNDDRDSYQRNDSDNESVSSRSSQPARGRSERGVRGRGRGGRGGNTERSDRGQESSQDGITEQPSREFEDDADVSFSESKVFKFLVREMGGCASVSKFKEEYSPLPSNFDEWIMEPKKRLSIYKRNHKPLFIRPFLINATVCVDHMGFGGNKKCNRKDCNHFHICNFFLNGWCKRGFKCRKGHTFTKGHNRVLKAKLGLNPFKDAEIKTIVQCRYPQICHKKRCPEGDDCPYLHICYNYIRDKCEDSDCPRGHDLETPHNLWVLSWYRMDKWTKEKLALLKFLINMPRKPRSKKNPGDGASTVDVAECMSNVDELDLSDDMEDDDDEEDDDVEEEEETDEEEEKVIYDRSYERNIPVPTEEVSTQRRRLDRKDRWAAGVEDTEFLDVARNPDTEASIPDNIAQEVTSKSITDKDAHKKDICVSSLLATCQERNCDKHHTRLPYLWQIRIYGDWVSFDDEENQKLEKSYCSLEDMEGGEVEYQERKYRVHMKFNEEKGVVYEIIHGEEPLSTQDVLAIRRLSTASFAKEKKPLAAGSFHTQWRWYYQDDANRWILYDKERFQYTLEKKYVMGQKSYLFTRESYRFKYRIDFTGFQQMNIDTAKVRKILRRPVFLSLADVAAKSFPPYLAVSHPGPKPPGWAPWDLAHDFELVDLEESNKEFRDVKSSFFSTLKEENFQICNIYRVQNLELWNEYKMKKTNMERINEARGGSVDERSLFHGTDSIDTCYGICTNNFDFRLSGKNATMYGQGSYFATTSKYSNCYTRGPLRLMLKAKVLIGSYTKGERDMKCPPNIPGEGHKRYDSCVDNMANPTIFVVFDRNQSYPEYLIAYKEKDDDSISSASNPAPFSMSASRPTSLGATAGSFNPLPANVYSGNAQNFSSSASNSSNVAQAYPSRAYTQASSAQNAGAQPSVRIGQVYSNPYLSSPTSPSDLPASQVSPLESPGLSYRTSSGRVERMDYPERKKTDDKCSIQ